MGCLDDLYRANACRHSRDCRGLARPNWPDAQRLETARCCHLFSARRAHAATRSNPGIVSQEQPLAPGPVFVGRFPPGVRRAMQYHVPQTVFDPVNAEAENDDGNGSFLLEQVVIANLHAQMTQGCTAMPRGFDHGDGWFDILWRLCKDLEPLGTEFEAAGGPKFEVRQVKEKFGGLRFYVTCRRSDAIRQRIRNRSRRVFSYLRGLRSGGETVGG
jgi:hypothetical protein